MIFASREQQKPLSRSFLSSVLPFSFQGIELGAGMKTPDRPYFPKCPPPALLLSGSGFFASFQLSWSMRKKEMNECRTAGERAVTFVVVLQDFNVLRPRSVIGS
ncbi:hypothetical protein RIF29_13997 [Crotalaria pallida]|uniref:Uncharacterized protein n=1 Tax=Crotalaria pallida TaxID=3830 RepID=A0AAN9FAG3_CROPI